ncbi:MAG TPA: sulfite exporter TauE/SafE family protein [Methylomirabilota bacterium]
MFTLGGALLVGRTSPDLLEMILGVFLVAYTLLSWSGRFSLSRSTLTAVVGGAVSGFLAGLIGTGGALRGAFLNAFGLPKERYIATAAAIALAVDVTRLPVYLEQGLLAPRFYPLLPLIFAVALLGSFIGKQVVGRISQPVFRRVVLGAIGLIGLKFIHDWAT